MEDKTLARIFVFVGVFVVVSIAPWWASALLIFALTIYFPMYLEAMFFGFLFDSMYGAKLSFPYFGMTIAFLILLTTVLVRPFIRVNS